MSGLEIFPIFKPWIKKGKEGKIIGLSLEEI